jgi:hypothetical protein
MEEKMSRKFQGPNSGYYDEVELKDMSKDQLIEAIKSAGYQSGLQLCPGECDEENDPIALLNENEGRASAVHGYREVSDEEYEKELKERAEDAA